MLLLALDTSTRQASVALCDEHTLFGEYTWLIGNNHSVQLLEHIQRLVAECGYAMQDIGGVAVATGPGSFNGVRVAVATAKTLAFALRKPLVGISTLDLVAAQQSHWPGPVVSLLDAGRSEVYAACFISENLASDGEILLLQQRLSDYVLLTPEALVTLLREQVAPSVGIPGEPVLPTFLFCGEVSDSTRATLLSLLPEKAFFVSTISSARRSSTLALLAFTRIQEGRLDDPLLLEPLYLRRPSITTSPRKQPLLGKKTPEPVDLMHIEREEGALRH